MSPPWEPRDRGLPIIKEEEAFYDLYAMIAPLVRVTLVNLP